MKKYTKMTLGDLITALRELPEGAKVRGFGPSIHSYRGYYERNALEPETFEMDAERTADILSAQEGTLIHGWKGGEYYVSLTEGIYLADLGDVGPIFAGLEATEDGVYEPILLDDGDVW